MTHTREEVVQRVSELLGGRAVRWSEAAVGDCEGRERTLEVLEADAAEHLALARALRPVRSELHSAVGGPIGYLLHGRAESRRLLAEFLDRWRLRRFQEIERRVPEAVFEAERLEQSGCADEAASIYDEIARLEEELARLLPAPNVVPVPFHLHVAA